MIRQRLSEVASPPKDAKQSPVWQILREPNLVGKHPADRRPLSYSGDPMTRAPVEGAWLGCIWEHAHMIA